MKIRCGNCDYSFDVPDGYPVGEKIKCPKCKKALNTDPLKKAEPPKTIDLPKTAPRITEPQIPVTQKPVSKNNLFRVLMVITIMIILISGLIILANKKQAKTPIIYSLEQVKKVLAENHLYLVDKTGKRGILRGRVLYEYKFSEDATKTLYLSLWADETDKPCGITLFWEGNRYGAVYEPNCPYNSESSWAYVCVDDLIRGFESLTGIDPSSLENKKFEYLKENDKHTFLIQNNGWNIEIIRLSEFGNPPAEGISKLYKSICDIQKINYNVYFFTAIARNW